MASTTTGAVDEDFVAQASDFGNIKDMTAVRGFFIDNRLGHLDRALAVANDPDGGVYPVGTIVQRFPQEAMVKRKAGFAPDVGDWEFLVLSVSPTGTEITNRGTREIKNILDKSCASCHLQADARYDLVCEKTHGCDPLGVPDEFFTRLQDSDPRPRRRL